MNFVLDTNILLVWLKDPVTKRFIEDEFSPMSAGNTPIISAVTVGEIRSLALKNSWGQKRIAIVEELMDELVVIDVRFNDLFDAYARIDAYSQGKLGSVTFSARNMGKNDLWIAATAYVTDSQLITTDKDFDHLAGDQLKVAYIERRR